MKHKGLLISLVLGLGLVLPVLGGGIGPTAAQGPGPEGGVNAQAALGTAFTYQGLLKRGNAPVTGDCSMAFRLYDASSGGNQVGSAITPTVTISNSLFTVPLDFGASPFVGEARWLGIRVKCQGDTVYADLGRQLLTAAPYALYSTSTGGLQGRSVASTAPGNGQVLKWNGSLWAPADDSIGPPGSGDITGVYAGAGLTGGGTTGEVTVTVAFEGSGTAARVAHSDHDHAGVYALPGHTHAGSDITSAVPTATLALSATNADLLDGQHGSYYQRRVTGTCAAGNAIRVVNADGSVTCEPATGSGAYWSLTGNAGTNPAANFLGTTDNVSLTLAVSGTPALRLIPNATSPNLVGGYSGNSVTAGAAGATIGGGGAAGNLNRVTDDYGTVGGGSNNRAGNNTGTTSDRPYATVGGGQGNTASGESATVGGGGWNTASGNYSTVGGGDANAATADHAALGGGGENWAGGSYAAIGGGASNLVTATYGTIAGGYNITVTGNYATVAGGSSNTASSGAATVAGGYGNIASGFYAAVGGGYGNTAGGNSATVGGGVANATGNNYATVGGGGGNTALGEFATIGGGDHVSVTGRGATVAGGSWITASGDYASVGGGSLNTASGIRATVGGGTSNNASSDFATIGGGFYNSAVGYATVGGGEWNSALGSRATIGGGRLNAISGDYATIAGGYNIIVTGDYATVGGGADNAASMYFATVGGGRTNTASGWDTTVGGGQGNTASGPYATIGGGGSNKAITGTYTTVGGGYGNTASGLFATVGGGETNSATQDDATVGGGYSNEASGGRATVGGGYDNTASGNAATVPGGANNEASAPYSFAAGADGHATHEGSFVWSSYERTDSWGNQTFTVRAHGGARFYSASGTSLGVQLSSNGTSWGSVSDRNVKENFADVDGARLLEMLAAMPVQTWNLRAQSPQMRHIGPVAQDFNGLFAYLFGQVEDPLYINTMDAVGISLAANQGLYELSQEQAARIAQLESENTTLREENASQQAQLDALAARVAALEAGGGGAAQSGLLPWAGAMLAAVAALRLGARRKGGGL